MFQKVSLSKVFSSTRLRTSKVLSFLRIKAPLAKDTIELSQRIIHPPTNEKALAYFTNRNIPIESLGRDEPSKEAYSLIQRYRKGDKDTAQVVTNIKYVVDNAPHEQYLYDFKNEALNRFAFIYRLLCKSHFNQPLAFNPLDYQRLYRTIGENEYKAVLDGQHIVAKSCNDIEVMVTNNPNGVAACTGGKGYFVHFKDNINFDPIANPFFKLSESNVPNVRSHNIENAEYYITGGYNIDDVAKIIDMQTKKVVYSSKS